MSYSDAVASPTSEHPARAEAAPREFTARGIALGVALALILGAANAYLGLYAGLTVSASIPAAVISMAILRILGGSTILENNFVQTIASAGEAVAAGAIFTFPALVIMGGVKTLPYVEVTALSVVGATMGALLVVFLRRAYIVEEALPFPEGVACAQVLRAGNAASNVRPLLIGGVISAMLKTSQDIFGFIPGAISGARFVGRAAIAGSLDISAALLGVGYIIGIRIATLVFAGGAFAWLIAIPLLTAVNPKRVMLSHAAFDAAATAAQLWSNQVRYLGVGAMLTGGVVTLWRLRARISAAIADSIRAMRTHQEAVVRAREDTDLSASAVLIAVACCIPVIFAICFMLSGQIALSAALAILLTLIGFFATAIAGYLTGIVGASNNPVSGVTVIVLLAVALFLKFIGVSGTIGPQLAILSGAIVCTAAAMAGDSTHDLATGYHVGATPRVLEIGVLIGAIASSFLMAPILNLLIAGYGIAGTATARAGALAAPQAFLMAKVTQGVFNGGLPLGTIAIGAALAAILGLSDRYLERAGSQWRTPIMPVAIGLYLPFGLSVTIFLGALVHAFFGAENADESGPGILLAAGLVAGEALMGVASGAMVTAGLNLPIF
ncbi:MAG: oligopeptide transporter, OPT family [Candidatus Binatus sp.]|uniref:OPT family oligopeptide transporter n=1 Tax=Candidatus Binatus sp. TaxID=2811406 RepID=UPI00271B98DF|nr:oligopeptide transporter, OPT family [Candidatus Binatus sp.]MDO8432281.1 oligopeptide transporter, OPT family [Candidatus Binatus sp.]